MFILLTFYYNLILTVVASVIYLCKRNHSPLSLRWERVRVRVIYTVFASEAEYLSRKPPKQSSMPLVSVTIKDENGIFVRIATE
jgi:hypothetical protein